jgi:hypothetical protein
VGTVDESLRQIQLSSTTQVLRESSKNLLDGAVANPTLKSAVAGLVRGISSRQILPGRSRPQHPKNSIEHVARIAVRPAPDALLDRLFLGENRPNERPLLFGEVHIKVRSNLDPPVDPLPKSDRISRT